MDPRVGRAVAAVRDRLREGDFSGTVLIAHKGEPLLEHASGLANRADRVPVHIGTRFGVASVTKTFTAVALCRLVDARAVDFSTKVVDILARDKRPATMSTEVTLHHLLTHTSGIADFYDEVKLGAAAFEYVWRDHASYLMRSPLDFVPLFANHPPLKPPGGNVASYCNAGFIMLGLVIEELSDIPYTSFVESEVFGVAGMRDSAFLGLDEVHESVAIGYIPPDEDGSGWRTNHYSIPVVGGPDGGAFSTVHDLNAFLDALSTGVLMSDQTWRIMSHPHVAMEDISYGYGLAIAGDGRSRWFGHGGADPGFSARAFRYPEPEVNVAMLGNTIDETDPLVEVFRSLMSE